MNLYIGNLSHEANEEDLHDLFAQFGGVISIKIMTDAYTGRSRGFAFVELADKESGEAAIQKLNETEFMQRNIVVNEAKPKPPGNNRDRGGSGGGGFRSGPPRGGGGGNRRY